MRCYFVTDLHGRIEQYNKLFDLVTDNPPDRLFIGGDILPSGIGLGYSSSFTHVDFINDFLLEKFFAIKEDLKDRFPIIYIILGNDDGRTKEAAMLDASTKGVWKYIHNRKVSDGRLNIYGYSLIPPSPFQLKDWERYDVSRFVDPGAISPEEGKYTFPITDRDKKYRTIADDLQLLTGPDNLSNSIMLFHVPPYQTNLDRAALDGKMIDYVPLDVHVGSIAVRRLIKKRQPLLTLHGHVHESAQITGKWKDRIGKTYCFSAAHNGIELAVVKFDTEDLYSAERILI